MFTLYSGQNDAAIECLLQVQIHPKFAMGYEYLGDAYMKVGQKDLGIENFQKSMELNPQDFYSIGKLKKLRGNS